MRDVNESEAHDLLKGVAATFDDNVPSLYRMLARGRVALAAFANNLARTRIDSEYP